MDVLKNPMVRTLLTVILALYILGIVPALNREIKPLFGNPIFQVLMIIGIIQLSYYDLLLAMLLAVAFIMSIHFTNFLDVQDMLDFGLGRKQPVEGQEWNDPAMGDDPVGYNVDKYCGNNWEFQCQGVNTFGPEFNTQGMNSVQGYGHSADYSAADF